VWGSQVETTEAGGPVLITRRELRPDSGGAGRTRGGLGQHIELCAARPEDLLLFLSVERVQHPARGRFGGKDGAPGRIRIGQTGPDLPGKGQLRVTAGQTLIFETPGGGGFGDPHDRPVAEVAHDLREGLITPTAARDTYGHKP